MAETKTTIPVEIKMGNSGTNDANLPAFKEGSIIFTKDTKKIYIDPVGETERIEIGGTDVVVDSELSKTSTNPVQNKIINSALSNKQDKFADLNYVWSYSGNSVNQLSLVLKSASRTTSTGGVVISLIPTLSLTNETGQDVGLTGIAAPTADNDAVNRGYLTTKYGSTYYESQDKQYYLPSGSNMVIPNSNMGRLFIGSESAASADFKIYVNDPLDDGKLIITNLKTPTNNEDAANKTYVDTETAKKQGKFADISYENNIATNDKLVLTPNVDNAISEVYFNIDGAPDWKMGTKAVSAPYFKTKNGYIIANTSSMPPILMSNVTTQATTPIINFESAANNNATILRGIADGLNDNDAVNVSQLVKKQDKFATVTTENTIQTVKIGDDLSIVTSPNFGYSQISSTKILTLSGADSASSYVSLRKTKLENNCDFDATQGYLRVRNDPLADDFAVNKKYVDDIKTELLNAITHPYTYDETTKELTLIL